MRTVDKGLLGFIWSMAMVYAVMCEQVVSKNKYIPCNIYMSPSNVFGLISILSIIVLPTFVGPVTTFIIHLALSWSTQRSTLLKCTTVF